MGVWGWEWESELSDTKTWCYAISTAKRYQFQLYICFWYRYHCGVSERKLNECEREAHGIEFIFFLLLTFHWIFFLPRFKFAQFVLLLQSHSTQLRLNVSLGKKNKWHRALFRWSNNYFPAIKSDNHNHHHTGWQVTDWKQLKCRKKFSHSMSLIPPWNLNWLFLCSFNRCRIDVWYWGVWRDRKSIESVFDDEITTLNKVLIRFQWHILIKVSAESEKITTQ